MNKFDLEQLVGKTIASASVRVNREGNFEPDFLTLEFTDGSEFALEIEMVQPRLSYTNVKTREEDVPPGTVIYRNTD